MNVLLIGSGGREHAMAWALAKSESVATVYVAPGNAGTSSQKIQNVSVPIKAPEFKELLQFCTEHKIALVAVGPEQPLCDGVADVLISSQIPVFGPSQAAAQIEASKAFSKDFMQRHGIPTAAFRSFKASELQEAIDYIKSQKSLQVVKASGLAAGKGVIVPQTVEESIEAVRDMLGADGSFGAAGTEIVLEELMEGPEISLFAFSDGKTVVPLLPAQDHKRAFDGDKGPNTGGMGAYCPAPVCTPEVYTEIVSKVLEPAVAGMAQDGAPYKGLLYAGVMLTRDGVKNLEFNCRFGDPETQVVLPLLKTDLFQIMMACSAGNLEDVAVEFHDGAAATVVMASAGYPNAYPKGKVITGLDSEFSSGVIVFHAGTARKGDETVTSGGRVLAMTAVAPNLLDAVTTVYKEIDNIKFEGAFYRKDIAHQAIGPEN